ncbi:MAG: site-specific integrase [Rhizobium sp.]|nr:MAG: site-specific integrase [Rhizobium sp.]
MIPEPADPREPPESSPGPVAAVVPPTADRVVLAAAARRAAEEIIAEGTAANTTRSYDSALRYWAAWSQLRLGRALALPVAVETVVQFVVDHFDRRGTWELPSEVDAQLVEGGFKGKPGPLKTSTIVHRVAVLSKLHGLRGLENPCEHKAVRHLLSNARKSKWAPGRSKQKAAATRDPLLAMVATCDDSLIGKRDRALLLFAWSAGGRRRSEVAGAQISDLARIGDDYQFTLSRSKTNQQGKITEAKPIRGLAARALTDWLEAAGITEGPVFRRIFKVRVGDRLSDHSVAQIVKTRARLAGLGGNDSDWAGHSLRRGFVTEAGRQRHSLFEVMQMTEHSKVDSVKHYYESGNLMTSDIGDMLGDGKPKLPE